MTFIWLIVWLFNSTPSMQFWDNWTVALVVCAFIDIAGGSNT